MEKDSEFEQLKMKGRRYSVLALIVRAKIYLKCPRIYLPNLFAQAQKFWISMKKGFIGRP